MMDVSRNSMLQNSLSMRCRNTGSASPRVHCSQHRELSAIHMNVNIFFCETQVSIKHSSEYH